MKNYRRKNIIKTSVIGSLLLSGLLYWFYRQLANNNLPIIYQQGNEEKPLIFYITGDGGFNAFSKGIIKDFQQKGYEIHALNSKQYFWKKKTPEQTTKDVEGYLKERMLQRNNQEIIFIGFSFGADVTPFIYNRLTDDLKKKTGKLFFIGPSKSTDFAVHMKEFFGAEPKGSQLVVPEINKIHHVPITLILTNAEIKNFPFQHITLKQNYKLLKIATSHHFDGNTKMLTDILEKNF